MPATPISFTKKRIDDLPESTKSEDWYQDDKKGFTPKLRLRVSGSGNKNWYFYSKIDGVPRRISIGAYPGKSIDAARKAAKSYEGKIAIGKDPYAEIIAKRHENTRKSITLKGALDLHLANKAHKHSDRTTKEYRKVFHQRKPEEKNPPEGKKKRQEPQFEKWLDKPVIRITENMVESWFRRRISESPASAAVEGRYLRAVLTTAIAEHKPLSEHGNPCSVISRKSLWPDIQARKSYVKPKQMRGFLTGIEKLPEEIQNARFGDAKDFLRWLLFSGCRVEETAKLRPDDINIEDRLFILRDPKNRKTNTELPLNDELLKIAVKRLAIGDDYLFADATGSKPMQTPRKAINAIRELSETHFTPHDLRRTFRTAAAKIALPMKIGMRLVNHSISGDLKVDLDYIQVEPEELLEASNLVVAEIRRQGTL